MAEQELDLFELAAGSVAELGAGPAQIMRSDMLQT